MIDVLNLNNGIKVVLEECEHFNSVSIGVWVKVGSRNECKANNGIAHMTEHMLFKGTKTKTAGDIAKISASLGGNLNAYTSKECTSYYCKTLPELIGPAIEVLGDMICNSRIDDEDLENEKSVVCDEIVMYNDSAEDYVHEVLQKKVYRKHPLGYLISGKKKVVKGFTSEDIKDFIANYYTVDNMVISLAGKFQKKNVIKMLNKAFESVKKSDSFQQLTSPDYTIASFEKKQDIEQLHLNIVFPATSFLHEDRYCITLLNNILGGDVNSRLFQEIREKRGLTYNICSYGSAFSDVGLLHIYAALNPSQKDMIQEMIYNVIQDMTLNGISEEELAASKQQSIVELTLAQDDSGGRMNSNAKTVMFKNCTVSFEEVVENIRHVNRESVMESVVKYLDVRKASIGIVKGKH